MSAPKSLYERIGGAERVRALVERFYQIMDARPEASDVRKMHPKDLSESTDKLYEFLSGYLGGPALYHQKRGHPMLRRRHMPFAIDHEARDQWLWCMGQALEDLAVEPLLAATFFGGLQRVADHMRNQPEP